MWDLSLEILNNKLLVWIEFKFALNYYWIMQLEEKNKNKNMGRVGFKFIKFW